MQKSLLTDEELQRIDELTQELAEIGEGAVSRALLIPDSNPIKKAMFSNEGILFSVKELLEVFISEEKRLRNLDEESDDPFSLN